jgi:hypothetical protein
MGVIRWLAATAAALALVFVGGGAQDTLPPERFGFVSLKCLVCQALVDEIDVAIALVDPNKKRATGFRLTPTGDLDKKVVPLARSEGHLSEIHDTICEQFEEYAQAKEKWSGEVTIIRIMSRLGGMNPRFSEVDIVPDDDLNTRLKFYCQQIVEEREDDIMELFAQPEWSKADIQREMCQTRSGICKDRAMNRVADDDVADQKRKEWEERDAKKGKKEL